MGPRPPESTRLEGVFLARHGETDYNAQRRFQGLLPVPLNATGRAQAQQLALRAAEHGFAALWCSPLARARETAAIVAAALGLAPREDVRLVETDTGDWTDRYFDARSAEDPQGFAAFVARRPRLRLPGGESFRAPDQRVMAALDEIGRRPATGARESRTAWRSGSSSPRSDSRSTRVPNAALLDCDGAASSSGRAPDF
jgi:broad specificity phosphatase PhoE